LTTHLGVCCIILSAGLAACGGRATDGLLPSGSGPSLSVPEEEERETVRPRRETCADNPLLAECPQPYDFCRDNPQGPDCPSAPEPDSPENEPLAIVAATNILVSYCGACHGPGLSEAQASASINYIGDWSQLLQAGLIEECSPERSRVVLLMRTADMPPSGSGLPAVQDAAIDVVERAIELDCNDE
jgi:hypothetical protein